MNLDNTGLDRAHKRSAQAFRFGLRGGCRIGSMLVSHPHSLGMLVSDNDTVAVVVDLVVLGAPKNVDWEIWVGRVYGYTETVRPLFERPERRVCDQYMDRITRPSPRRPQAIVPLPVAVREDARRSKSDNEGIHCSSIVCTVL